MQRTDDLRVKEIKELVPPSHVLREFALSEKAAQATFDARQGIHRILHGADDRLLVIMGPCSIHDVKAAKEYAGRLKEMKSRLADDLLVVMPRRERHQPGARLSETRRPVQRLPRARNERLQNRRAQKSDHAAILLSRSAPREQRAI